MPTLEISQVKLELAKKAEEYYNALCTNLQLSGDDLKVFSITSVKAGEGKQRLPPISLGLLRVQVTKRC